jgi:hypothetical protein
MLREGRDGGEKDGNQAFTLIHRSTFKRLFLHKTKDKKYSLEGVEEMENTVSAQAVLEATTGKKSVEGWSGEALGGWQGLPVLHLWPLTKYHLELAMG